MSHRINESVFLILTLALLGVTPTEARDIESTERLGLLQRATGQTPSSNSFQRRVDAIFTTTKPSSEQAYVTREDLEMKQALSVGPETEGFLLEEKFQKKPIPKEEEGSEKEDQEQKDKHPLEIPLEPKVDAGEKDYQKQLDKIYKELDQRQEEIKTGQLQPEEEKEGLSKSALPPSLANNPFYFSPDDNRKIFEENKPIVASRLVQMGLPQAEAETLVQEAAGPEEVILALMQQEGFSYGEAASVVTIDHEEG